MTNGWEIQPLQHRCFFCCQKFLVFGFCWWNWILNCLVWVWTVLSFYFVLMIRCFFPRVATNCLFGSRFLLGITFLQFCGLRLPVGLIFWSYVWFLHANKQQESWETIFHIGKCVDIRRFFSLVPFSWRWRGSQGSVWGFSLCFTWKQFNI